MTALVKTNPAQRRAADPQKNVWVSASAGSGKTKVLVDRILSLLLAGANPQKILCLTFTRTAAAEMKQRLTAQLQVWAKLEREKLADALIPYLYENTNPQEALMRAPTLFSQFIDSRQSVRIMTIHSFCQLILQKFSIEAHVSSGFRVLDEFQSRQLLAESYRNILAHPEHETVRDAFDALSAQFSLTQCQEWLETLMDLKWRHWLNNPDAHQQTLHPSLKDVAAKPLTDIERRFVDNHLPTLKAIAKTISEAPLKPTDEASLSRIQDALNAQDDVSTAFAHIRRVFITQDRKPRTKIITKDIQQKFPEIAASLETLAEAFMPTWQLWQQRFFYDTTQSLFHVAQAMTRHYDRKKDALCALDYDDLIYKTVHLLEASDMASWVLYKLDGGLDHILVDEAQDTSHHQWRAIHAIVQEFFGGQGQTDAQRTLFVVGDSKQSIYSFQGADPDAFFRFRDEYAAKIQAAGYPWLDIPLNISYRSTQVILDIVDETFNHPAAAQGLFIKQGHLLHKAFRDQQWGQVTLWPLEADPRDKETRDFWQTCIESNPLQLSGYEMLAHKIATTITTWLKEQRPLVNHGRAVQASDIMILVQRRHKFTIALQKALAKQGVPFHAVDKIIWQEHQLFRDMIALAKVALLPHDNLTLATVLKGPVFDWDDSQLLSVRSSTNEPSLWKQLQAEETFADVIERIGQWQAWATRYSPEHFFRKVLYTGSCILNFQSLYGAETADLVDAFLQTVQTQCGDTWMSLQDFVNVAVTLKKDFTLQEPITNGVRIMTVHAAKGLQAPIVILPDTVRLDSKISCLHAYEESLLWLPSSEEPIPEELAQIRQQAKEKAIQESYRLLYVAMTRAEDELYVCGWDAKSSSKSPSWYSLIEQALLRKQAHAHEDGTMVFTSGQKPNNAKLSSVAPQMATPKAQALTLIADGYSAPPTTWRATPSQLNDQRTFSWDDQPSQNAQERGVTIHRLLEILPQMPLADLNTHVRTMLIRDDLRATVTRILNDSELQWLFGEQTYAEVPIHGYYRNLYLSATLDRVGITAERVWCVDYKTSRQVPEDIPLNYSIQMGAYGHLLQQLYPNKSVSLYILWTQTHKLHELDYAHALADFEAAAHTLITASPRE